MIPDPQLSFAIALWSWSLGVIVSLSYRHCETFSALVASKIALNHQTNFIRFRSGDFQFDLEYIQLFQLVLPLFTFNMYLTAEVFVSNFTFICLKSKKKVWNVFEVNNKNTERRQWRRSGVFIVNLEHIWHFFLVFLLLDLNR